MWEAFLSSFTPSTMARLRTVARSCVILLLYKCPIKYHSMSFGSCLHQLSEKLANNTLCPFYKGSILIRQGGCILGLIREWPAVEETELLSKESHWALHSEYDESVKTTLLKHFGTSNFTHQIFNIGNIEMIINKHCCRSSKTIISVSNSFSIQTKTCQLVDMFHLLPI